ncbi:MAG: hypothetical protein K8T20_11435 [Planctomycetes bacterium]|nr:hypothetical protein [Planctomycetota bacterium]
MALFRLAAPAHNGRPPTSPVVDETAPATISASASACDVTGISWCIYIPGTELKCKKNGSSVTLAFNGTSTQTPHAYHIEKTWNVNLTTLGLQSGDSLVWEYSSWATSGPDANVKVYVYKTTQVQ